MLNCRNIIYAPADREAWLVIRQMGIGGSDIAAICGASKYSTALQVYESKLNPPADFDNQYMEWGRRIEPLIAEKFQECHPELKVYRPTGVVYRHPIHDWALATVDGVLYDEEKDEFGILEIKTGGTTQKKEWKNGNIPEGYYLQIQWYFAVTGLKWGWFARLIGGNDYGEVYVERDDEKVSALLQAGKWFWEQNVLALTPPGEEW